LFVYNFEQNLAIAEEIAKNVKLGATLITMHDLLKSKPMLYALIMVCHVTVL